uniref:Transcription initiation factor TFIID subunit 12 n=1 Tax=Ditylenchus dipsaci TaxID=166011 RepID=A0A915DAH6_9BILA
MSGGKPAITNGISSSSGYSHGANNGLIYGNAANIASKALMNKGELEKLVKNVDGYTTLEDDVSEAVLLLLDDFVEEVIQGSAALSKHRGSKRLETKDVRYLLKHKFDMSLPPDAKTPLGGEDGAQSSKAVGPPAKRPALAIHQQRLAVIDKTLKKL